MKLTIVINPAAEVLSPHMKSWSDSQFENLVTNILKEVKKNNHTEKHSYRIISINENGQSNDFTSQKIKRELDKKKLKVELMDISLNPSSVSDNEYCQMIFDTVHDMLSENDDTICILVSYKLFKTFPNFYIKQKYPDHKDEFCSTTLTRVAAVINKRKITTIFPYPD